MHPSQLLYDTNVSDNNFNHFNMFLTNVNILLSLLSEFPLVIDCIIWRPIYHFEIQIYGLAFLWLEICLEAILQ